MNYQLYTIASLNYMNIMWSRNTQSEAYITYDSIFIKFKSRGGVSEVRTMVTLGGMGRDND